MPPMQKMFCKRTFDSAIDPPPDLIIDVGITQSLVSRLEILAALLVREVWRSDGEAVKCLVLMTLANMSEMS